jgi:hypothetical protein
VATGEDGERSRGQVGFKPGVGCVSYAEPVRETLEEYGMVNGGTDKMIIQSQEGSFSRVVFGIGRLEEVEK